MTEQLLDILLVNGYQAWVGLCAFVLVIGFGLCAGNLRRQILIALIVVLWGVGCSFYEEFYFSPIARYVWFPYWVLVEGTTIIFIYYLGNVSNFFSHRFNLINSNVKAEELRQELVVVVVAFLLIVLDIGQLGSALYGTGRITAELYDDLSQLLLSIAVIALILPGKAGLKALKDALHEKFIKLVASWSGSNRSVNKL